MSQNQDEYVCKHSGVNCSRCLYPYCIDGVDMDEAIRVIAEYKNTEDIKSLNQSTYCKRYYQKNIDKRRENGREYYQKNREKVIAYQKNRRKNLTPEQKERNREYVREYYASHREEIKEKRLQDYYRKKAANG